MAESAASGPAVTVRRLRRSDSLRVQALIDACGDQVLDVLASAGQVRDAFLVSLGVPPDIDPESKRVWVLERDEKMIGVVEGLMHHPRRGECLIRVFAVHPAARGRGVAGSAGRALLDRARHRGLSAITVVYRGEDTVQRSTLRSLGFRLDSGTSDADPPAEAEPLLTIPDEFDLAHLTLR